MNEELVNNEQTAGIIHNAFKFLERKDLIIINLPKHKIKLTKNKYLIYKKDKDY